MIKKLALHISDHWLLWCILVLGLSIRLWGTSFGLPGIDHGDEPEIINHAVRFGSGDLNPHRFQYGSLIQYVLFVIYGLYFIAGYCFGIYKSVHEFALAFVQNPSVFYLIARWLSACLGTATVYITYLIGRRLAGKTAGLLAAGFLAVCYQHTVHSHYATVDVALTFFFTLAVHRCIVLYETGSWKDYLLAGIFAGLACAVKFNGIFALLPLVLAHFCKRHESLNDKIFSPRLTAAVACIIAGHALASPFFYIELRAALREIIELNAMHRGVYFTLAEYTRLLLSTEAWGLPLGIICLWGMLSAPWRSKSHALLCISAAAILLFASRYQYVEAKYILHALPLLAVLAASSIIAILKSSRPRLIAAVALLLCASPLLLIIKWDSYYARKSINLEAKEWIEQNIPASTRILLDNTGNDGPKLENAPANMRRQYERAAAHGLLKADYLKLKAELSPKIHYDIVLVDAPEGSRQDDYERYRLWEDLETVDKPAQYYRDKNFSYLIITNRYFDRIGNGFLVIKEFVRDYRKIRIYKVPG